MYLVDIFNFLHSDTILTYFMALQPLKVLDHFLVKVSLSS